MKYRSEIDGLRAFAVVPVILFHAGFEIFGGGFVGVDVFFVISGYLITTIIINELDEGNFSIAKFYERRARRILPVLFFVVLCCLPFAWILLLPSDMEDFAQSILAVATFSSNILFWQESDYFDTAAELKPLLHTWSLAVEEQFYILFPLFLMAAWRFGKKSIVWLLVVTFVGSLAIAQWGAYNKPSAAFYLLPTRAWELLIGSFAAFYLQRGAAPTPPIVNNVLSAVGLAAILYSVFAFDETTPFPSLYALVPTVGTVLIILFATRGTLTHTLLSLRVIVGIGLISYSLYLWHQPVFAFWHHYHIFETTAVQMLTLSAICVLLAMFSYRFIEAPFRGKGALFNRAQVFSLSGGGLGILLVLGAFGHFTSGFEGIRKTATAENYAMIERLVDERQNAIRAGICHFNRRGPHTELDDFVENWDCTAGADAPFSIAIYGDSHAADKAVSLRENGLQVTQLGGGGCPLVKGDFPPYCDTLLDLFVAEISENSYDAIIISNRFEDPERTEDYMSRMIAFWSQVNTDVYLFSPMPERTNYERVFALNPALATTMPRDTTSSDEFFQFLETLPLSENIHVINSDALFCSMSENCEAVVEGQSLLTDYGHLSLFGAGKFGKLIMGEIPELTQ